MNSEGLEYRRDKWVAVGGWYSGPLVEDQLRAYLFNTLGPRSPRIREVMEALVPRPTFQKQAYPLTDAQVQQVQEVLRLLEEHHRVWQRIGQARETFSSTRVSSP